MNLNDLPDEMLCAIFDHLDLYELKKACFVCRRWSELTFSDRRMDRVLLALLDPEYLRTFMINSKRCYRNIRVRYYFSPDKHLESVVWLLHTIRVAYVRMLDLQCAVTSEELRLILLEAPELQHLSMNLLDWIGLDYCKTNGPFPILPKLKSLVFFGSTVTQFGFFPSKLNTPNLQCLNMSCSTDLELEVWKYFSRQLKLAHVRGLEIQLLQPLLELTFPLLEDLVFTEYASYCTVQQAIISSLTDSFFRRHRFLQRISICMNLPVEWVKSITNHCSELTHLALFLLWPYEGLLEPLVQLKKLKHLSLKGEGDRKILRGVMTSLESVELRMHPPRVFLENLFEIVPRFSCLQITERMSYDELQFICEKFSCLRRLEVVFCFKLPTVADDFVRFDRLVHLQDLKLPGLIEIRTIHPNNVRSLTLYGYSTIPVALAMTNDDLYQIPAKFPLLKRLFLKNWASADCVAERLHELMPSCRIDYNIERFYHIDDATAE